MRPTRVWWPWCFLVSNTLHCTARANLGCLHTRGWTQRYMVPYWPNAQPNHDGPAMLHPIIISPLRSGLAALTRADACFHGLHRPEHRVHAAVHHGHARHDPRCHGRRGRVRVCFCWCVLACRLASALAFLVQECVRAHCRGHEHSSSSTDGEAARISLCCRQQDS